MNQKSVLFTITRIIVFLTVVSSITQCSSGWKVPESLNGSWIGNQKVRIRTKDANNHFLFIDAPDSVLLTLNISLTGLVTGSFGNARLEGCTVNKNRGWLGKKLNIQTDYILKGKLIGQVFQGDPLAFIDFSLPFNLKDNSISGGLIQFEGGGIFPMAGILMIKK